MTKLFILLGVLFLCLSFVQADVEVFSPDAGWYSYGFVSPDGCVSIWSDKSVYQLQNELKFVPEYVCGLDDEGKQVCSWVTRHDVVGQFFDAKIRLVNNCNKTIKSELDLFSTLENIEYKTFKVDKLLTRVKDKDKVVALVEASKSSIDLKKVEKIKDKVNFDAKDFLPVERLKEFTIPGNSEIIINKRITASGSGEFGVGFGGAFLDPIYGSFNKHVIPVRPDALVAGYSFNGDANDFVGSNHGVVYGATLTESRFGGANKAYDFNELAKDYIDLNYNLFENSFTFGIWIKTLDTSSPKRVIEGSNDNKTGISIFINSNRLNYRIGIGTSYVANIIDYTSNEWNFISVSYDGNDVIYYLNGIKTGKSEDVNFNSSTSHNLGGRNPIGTQSWNGQLDDVLIYNEALSEDEVKALYQFGRLVGGYALDDANDVSFNQNHGTINGATLTENRFGELKAYDFNSLASNYINTNINYDSTQPISLSVWYNQNSVKDQYILGLGDVGSGIRQFIGIAPDNKLKFRIRGGTITSFNNPGNGWNHIVLIYDGTIANAYANNVLLGSVDVGTRTDLVDIIIGSTGRGDSGFFDGSIDDVAIFNYALDENEIKELYYRGNYLNTGDWVLPEVNAVEGDNILTLTCNDFNLFNYNYGGGWLIDDSNNPLIIRPSPSGNYDINYFCYNKNYNSSIPSYNLLSVVGPQVSNLTHSITRTNNTISFDSDKNGTYNLFWGLTTSYGQIISGTLEPTNSTIINNLTCGTTYNYKIQTIDEYGIDGNTINQTFNTNDCPLHQSNTCNLLNALIYIIVFGGILLIIGEFFVLDNEINKFILIGITLIILMVILVVIGEINNIMCWV